MQASAVPIVLTRLCKCPCGKRFTVPRSRPGQEYIFGHALKAGAGKRKKPSLAPNSKAIDPAKEAAAEAHRRRLDFGLAAASCRVELRILVHRIDAIDDEVVILHKRLKALEAEKEALTAQHLAFAATEAALALFECGKTADLDSLAVNGIQ